MLYLFGLVGVSPCPGAESGSRWATAMSRPVLGEDIPAPWPVVPFSAYGFDL